MENLPENMNFIDYDIRFAYLHMRCNKSRYVPFAKEYLNSGLYSQELISSKEYDAMKVKRHIFEKVYDLSYLLKPLDENAWITDKIMS